MAESAWLAALLSVLGGWIAVIPLVWFVRRSSETLGSAPATDATIRSFAAASAGRSGVATLTLVLALTIGWGLVGWPAYGFDLWVVARPHHWGTSAVQLLALLLACGIIRYLHRLVLQRTGLTAWAVLLLAWPAAFIMTAMIGYEMWMLFQPDAHPAADAGAGWSWGLPAVSIESLNVRAVGWALYQLLWKVTHLDGNWLWIAVLKPLASGYLFIDHYVLLPMGAFSYGALAVPAWFLMHAGMVVGARRLGAHKTPRIARFMTVALVVAGGLLGLVVTFV